MKKNNDFLGVLVIFLSILVLGLSGFIVYDKVLTKDESEEDNSINNEVKLSNEEARKVVEEKTKLVFDYVNSLLPYCGERDSNDYIEVEGIKRWEASTSYSSKDELFNYLRTFMSDEVINEYGEKAYQVPIYKVENNKLYCYYRVVGGGSYYNSGKTHYQILNVTENSIDAIGYVFFINLNEMMTSVIPIRLEKNDKNDWIMVSYTPFNNEGRDLWSAEYYLNNIIFANRTNPEHKIAVYYDGREFIDSQEIENLKTEINMKYGYENVPGFNIYIDYDDVGYIRGISLSPSN